MRDGFWCLALESIYSAYPCLNSSLILGCNLSILPNSIDFIGHSIPPPSTSNFLAIGYHDDDGFMVTQLSRSYSVL